MYDSVNLYCKTSWRQDLAGQEANIPDMLKGTDGHRRPAELKLRFKVSPLRPTLYGIPDADCPIHACKPVSILSAHTQLYHSSIAALMLAAPQGRRCRPPCSAPGRL